MRAAPLTFTPLGLGTAPLGGLFSAVSDEDAESTLTAAWEGGLRVFDTAPLYGFGLAERRLGAFLRGKPRDQFVLTTKAGRLLRHPGGSPTEDAQFKNAPPLRPVFDFSRDGILRSHEDSLARLGLDRVDLLLLHDPDHHFDAASTTGLDALLRLRADGTVRAIGAGMNQSEMLARFARLDAFDYFLLAGRYTLLEQASLRELLPLCLEHGVGIVIGGVYNSGILAIPAPGTTFDYETADPMLIRRARRLAAVCARFDVPLKAAAIQFPSAHPAVVCTLTGARTAAEVAENIAMFDRPVPAALWQALRDEGLIDPRAPTPAGR